MSVFEDLKAIKETYKDSYFPLDGKLKITKEQYNAFINDKRTFKERYKDTIKFLKRYIKCLKKK